jgi:hypothetical protein
VILLSLAQANLHFKNGSPTNELLSIRTKFPQKGKMSSKTVLSLISPKGYTITGENLITYTGYTKPGSLQPKRGNLGQRMNLNYKTFLLGYLLTGTLTLTYYFSKHLLECSSQHGGKIAEKAKAEVKTTDTLKYTKTIKNPLRGWGLLKFYTRKQNSVSLIKVSKESFGRKYSTKDLLTKSRIESSISDLNSYKPHEGKKIIERKQIELVRLAEKHGIHDTKVFALQLILVRSLAFREYSSWLILSKSGEINTRKR